MPLQGESSNLVIIIGHILLHVQVCPRVVVTTIYRHIAEELCVPTPITIMAYNNRQRITGNLNCCGLSCSHGENAFWLPPTYINVSCF